MKLHEVAGPEQPKETEHFEPAYAEEAEVPEYVFPILKQKIDKLNKRAIKLGLPPIQLAATAEFMKDVPNASYRDDEGTMQPSGGTHKEKYFRISIQGSAPHLAGWKFAARVQHTGEENIIDVLPGEDSEQLRQFRHTKSDRCDHCKVNRHRIDTFIVRNEESGEYKQIGRNCLKDFLGLHKEPKEIIWYLAHMSRLGDMIEDAEREWRGSGSRGEIYVPVDEIIAGTVELVDKVGYIKKDDPQGREPTVGLVRSLMMTRPFGQEDKYMKELRALVNSPSEKSKEAAKKIIDWANSIPEEQRNREQFYQNVSVILRNGSAASRNLGYVVALVPMYARAMNMLKQRENRSNLHMGTPGQKVQNIRVKVTNVFTTQNDFGPVQNVRMEDEAGNMFVWWNSSSKNYEQGEQWYNLTASVKKHDNYKGRNQTVVTRAKLVPVTAT